MDIKSDDIKLQAFCMHANIYFIGNEEVSVHLIDTSDGLVLIDTGYPDMGELIMDNIVKMGFDPKNICAIFHSHGHIDHFGCTQMLKELSGAKTYIGKEDNDIVNGKRDLSWAREIGVELPTPFSCDTLIDDGDCFDFGDTRIRCLHTPGHTDGVISFFVTLNDGTVAAMHGGVGANSMASDFLKKYGLSFDCRTKFRDGLKRLESEKVDLVLGNHPEYNNTADKMVRKLKAGENVCDSGEWERFLLGQLRKIVRIMETDPEI